MPQLRRTISGNDHYQRSSGLSSVRQHLYLSHSQQLYKLHQAAMQQQDTGLQRRLAAIHSSIEAANGQDHQGVAMTAPLPGHDRMHSSGGSDDGLIVIGDESCTSGRLPLLPAGRRGGSLSRRWSAAAEAAVAAARRSDAGFDGGDGDSDDGRDSQYSSDVAETDELQVLHLPPLPRHGLTCSHGLALPCPALPVQPALINPAQLGLLLSMQPLWGPVVLPCHQPHPCEHPIPQPNHSDSPPSHTPLQEERLLLLWANSLVPGGCASLLGEDMQCGWLLLQLVDCMEPGCVDWRLASRPPFKKVRHPGTQM